MQYKSIIRIVGILTSLFSVTMLPPALVSLIYKDGGGSAFTAAFLVIFFTGVLLWYPVRSEKDELKSREGFIIVVAFWIVLGSLGAVPFMMMDEPDLSLADSVFESFSGLTTTGATVMTGLDYLPRAVQYYRQQLQWLGGMGIIVLAVAILPMLGVGGMQLYRAETPGPVKDSKMTPRIADTAKHLWYIYMALTIGCALAYWGAGMSGFDALLHSFSTIAIGGFSNHDTSMGYFNSSTINMVCCCFLFLSAINFSLHYAVVNTRSAGIYLRDPEFKVFFVIQVSLILLCFVILAAKQTYESDDRALDMAIFQAISMSTTAGFATDNFSTWPMFLPILLIFSSFIGGCAGSTGGGMKVVRIYLLYLQGVRELNRLVHPKAIYAIKLGRKAVPDRVVEAVWGFFSAYALVFIIVMLALLGAGLDNITAFSATAACLNNLGPGLGEVAAHYGNISDSAKWICAVAMVFGRLEVFTMLVLFTPTFWRS